MDKQAYSREEFCEMHSIGRSFFYEEVARGNIRIVKAGRKTLVLADDARRWREMLPAAKDAA